jgi:hypothetical protein
VELADAGGSYEEDLWRGLMTPSKGVWQVFVEELAGLFRS